MFFEKALSLEFKVSGTYQYTHWDEIWLYFAREKAYFQIILQTSAKEFWFLQKIYFYEIIIVNYLSRGFALYYLDISGGFEISKFDWISEESVLLESFLGAIPSFFSQAWHNLYTGSNFIGSLFDLFFLELIGRFLERSFFFSRISSTFRNASFPVFAYSSSNVSASVVVVGSDLPLRSFFLAGSFSSP